VEGLASGLLGDRAGEIDRGRGDGPEGFQALDVSLRE